MTIEILAGLFIFFELITFYRFYNGKKGRESIYFTSWAWHIDALAILCGFYILGFSIYLYYQGADIPKYLLIPLFVGGSWQSLMHVDKWLVRMKTGSGK
jgi:hypothetical protein